MSIDITFSTCWYIMNSKHTIETFLLWIDNFLSNINNFNLVVYTDDDASKYFLQYLNNPRIKIIIKPINTFYNYKYKEEWIKNEEILKKDLINIDWKLNMLWSEKINFVKETIQEKYYNTNWYGWCDIGYFRCNENDLSKEELTYWPSNDKINNLNKEKIYYSFLNNNTNYYNIISKIVKNKNINGLPKIPIPLSHLTIGGGFFLIYKDKINWWFNLYDTKLKLYFKNNYLVKDDQIILTDCILSNINFFILCLENNSKYNNWFMFQRLLL